MNGGFSFCGIDIADLELEYAPDNTNTYVYRGSDQKINETSFEGHDGGYFYGATVSTKPFSLRCFYQDKHVNSGIITQIEHVFKIGKTGKLVFKKRPWVEYVVTVVDLDVTKMLNYQNGIVIISMKAYHPFGKLVDGYSDIDDNVMRNSAQLDPQIVPTTSIIGAEAQTQQKSFLLYNGGTERTSVAIELAGNVGEGVFITNSTTLQKCRFVALSDEQTTSAGKYIISDGISGKTVLTDGMTAKPAFLYHDYGFIDLEPAYPIKRDIVISRTQGSTAILAEEAVFEDDDVGKYVYLGGAWRQIVAVESSTEATVPWSSDETQTETTNIVTMNELTITPESEMSISRLNFIYRPTFK